MQPEQQPPQIRQVWSAGGVLIRRNTQGQCQVVICGRTEEDLWALPKGTPEEGETPEQAALREVQEETGIIPNIIMPLSQVSYTFTRTEEPQDQQQPAEVEYHKTVYYFLMTPHGGAIEKHDHEFDKVLWMECTEAQKVLTYPADAEIVAQAANKL